METNCVNITREAIESFNFEGEVVEVKAFGQGLINATYLVVTRNNSNEQFKYVLQKINHNIFKDVEKLMINYCNVCNYLKDIVSKRNGNIERETITVIPTKDNKKYVKDSEGCYWRAIKFIPDTITYETISSPEDFYKTGKAFGKFQNMLTEYKADTLYESIPNFHNTKERFKTFLKAVEENKSGRKDLVKEEIQFILDRQSDTSLIVDMLSNGTLPLRVTHNDTKLNNILMDKDTKEGICVIDLDTIMPGAVLYDFGDAIRTGATYAKEDEENLDKVNLDLELYEAFTKGFIEGTKGTLTEKEIEMLPMGSKIITLEQGMRFLTDYLDGDIYYKTNYSDHNLVRTRTQLKLVKQTEECWDKLIDMVNKYTSK